MYRINYYILIFIFGIIATSLLSCNNKSNKNEISEGGSNTHRSTTTSKDTMSHEEARERIREVTDWGELKDSTDEFTGYKQINSEGTRPVWIEKGPGDYGGALMQTMYTYDPEIRDNTKSSYALSIYAIREKSSTSSIECSFDIGLTTKSYILADGERIKITPNTLDPVEKDEEYMCPLYFTFRNNSEKINYRKIAFSDTVRMRSNEYTFTIPYKSRMDMRKIWNRTHN